jgi:uncharacterized membrane protein YvbJ
MQCPECKAENREGTTRCACGVSLVDVKIARYLRSIDNAVSTIKNIMVIWGALSLVAVILWILIR